MPNTGDWSADYTESDPPPLDMILSGQRDPGAGLAQYYFSLLQLLEAALYTEKHAASHTIDAAECYGGVHYVTAAATITLPPAAPGMRVTVIATGAFAVSVDPNANDLIVLDGVALDDGDKITSPGAAGDLVVLTYYDATGWYAASNTWTDGGA